VDKRGSKRPLTTEARRHGENSKSSSQSKSNFNTENTEKIRRRGVEEKRNVRLRKYSLRRGTNPIVGGQIHEDRIIDLVCLRVSVVKLFFPEGRTA
jgi:hypothetical protein